ncbi:HAMP domain-containing histidine kinase [Psychrosphaera sp. B3R10]|nr:HAMP domain-containing histidine kinase [Psychrosphaera sp. I2R16]MBU2990308.1 HAMP domain-containing histidine kinase [Psychrosphaera sp. B3R10]
MSKKTASSLKTTILTSILMVGILSLVLSVSVTIYKSNEQYTREASFFVQQIAKIVAYNSIIPVAFNQQGDLDDKQKGFLNTINNIKEVSHIHIYRYDDFSEELTLFASYIKKGATTLRPQYSKVKTLKQPVFTERYIEYAEPIYDHSFEGSTQNPPIGYVYLRYELTQYLQYNQEMLTWNTIVAAVVIALSILASFYVLNKVVAPINRFVREIQLITQNKAFDSRVKSTNLIEMNMVAESMNAMLAKINWQIHQSAQAEKEITELNQNLEEKVISRTQALRDSNQELLDALEQVHQYQSQVIQSEKMASLGQMVAGVAHEVNTPIGLGVTASTMLSDKIDEISEAMENQKLSARKLSNFLVESKENTQIIYRNLSRAADLISSFKQVAVDQSADINREVNIKSFFEDILLSLNPTLKQTSHVIDIDCDENLVIKSKPGPLNQIIINLIMNSIIHGFDQMDRGLISIRITQRANTCTIHYSDNGSGIEEKIKQKIFDPFVTTRRGEGGSGLGMHLVYNLVTQALNGRIEVTSELGNGASFDIQFPAVQVLEYES